MRIVNTDLLFNPLNWGIVLAVSLIMSWAYVHAMEAVRCDCNADNGVPD